MSPAGLAGPGGGWAGPTDRATTFRRPSGLDSGCAGPTDRATTHHPTRGAEWRLRRLDRPSDGLPPALCGRTAAAPDRPTMRRPPAGTTGPFGGCAGPVDLAMASRQRSGAVWQLHGTDRPFDDLPTAYGAGRSAASDQSTERRPLAGPAGPDTGCVGRTDRAQASRRALWGRVVAAPQRPTVRRSSAGSMRPGGGCAGPVDRATTSRRPLRSG